MSLLNYQQVNVVLEIDPSGDLIRSLMNIFETDMPKHLQSLKEAIDELSYDNIKKVSHLIKSSSLNIGAAELANIAESIEQSSDVQLNQFEKLEQCFEETVRDLRGYIKNLDV